MAAPFAAPLAYLLVRTLQEGGFWSTVTDRALLAPLARSLVLASAVALAAATVGTLAAWLVARTDLPGRRVLRLLLPLPLVLPSFIGAFALIAAFATGGIVERALSPVGLGGLPRVEGFLGAFIVLTLLTYPYVYLPVAARLRQLPPAMEESSRLLGRGPAATFRAVVLPAGARGDRGRRPDRLPLRHRRLRRGPAPALRHADARDLRQPPHRPARSPRPSASCWACWRSWSSSRSGA